MPALSLDSAWAWFYYSTFAVQVIVVTAYMLRHEVVAATHELSYDAALDTYIATLLGVSASLPAMAAYSLLIAVTMEVIRMIAERYLAKRFRQGKVEGIAQGKVEGIAEGITQGKVEGIAEGKAEVLGMLDEDTRREVERKLRRNGNSKHFPQGE